MVSGVDLLARRLVPDALWDVVEPLLPRFEPRRQGGGSGPLDERAVFTAVVYVLTHGCAWRQLPDSFRVSAATAHRRYAAWTRAALWERLREAALDRQPGRAAGADGARDGDDDRGRDRDHDHARNHDRGRDSDRGRDWGRDREWAAAIVAAALSRAGRRDADIPAT
jgi:transposase